MLVCIFVLTLIMPQTVGAQSLVGGRGFGETLSSPSKGLTTGAFGEYAQQGYVTGAFVGWGKKDKGFFGNFKYSPEKIGYSAGFILSTGRILEPGGALLVLSKDLRIGGGCVYRLPLGSVLVVGDAKALFGFSVGQEAPALLDAGLMVAWRPVSPLSIFTEARVSVENFTEDVSEYSFLIGVNKYLSKLFSFQIGAGYGDRGWMGRLSLAYGAGMEDLLPPSIRLLFKKYMKLNEPVLIKSADDVGIVKWEAEIARGEQVERKEGKGVPPSKFMIESEKTCNVKLNVKVFDKSGKSSSASAEFTLDASCPVIEYEGEPIFSKGQSLSLNVKVSDDVGIADAGWFIEKQKIEGKLPGKIIWNGKDKKGKDLFGYHTLVLWAKDKAGNFTQIKLPVGYFKDKGILLVWDENEGKFKVYSNVEGTIEGVAVSKKKQVVFDLSNPNIPEGDWIVFARSGKVESNKIRIKWDKTPPSIKIKAPQMWCAPLNPSGVRVIISVDDINFKKAQIKVGNGGKILLEKPLKKGVQKVLIKREALKGLDSVNVLVKAWDRCGNVGSSSTTVKIGLPWHKSGKGWELEISSVDFEELVNELKNVLKDYKIGIEVKVKPTGKLEEALSSAKSRANEILNRLISSGIDKNRVAYVKPVPVSKGQGEYLLIWR